MATRHQSIFLLVNLSDWGHRAPPRPTLPGNGLGGIPQRPLFSTQLFWGLWGLRVLTSCVPLPTGQRGTQESGSLWGRDIS